MQPQGVSWRRTHFVRYTSLDYVQLISLGLSYSTWCGAMTCQSNPTQFDSKIFPVGGVFGEVAVENWI